MNKARNPFFCQLCKLPLSHLNSYTVYPDSKYKQTKFLLSISVVGGFRVDVEVHLPMTSSGRIVEWRLSRAHTHSLSRQSGFHREPFLKKHTAWQCTHSLQKANWFSINAHLLKKQMNILMTFDNLSISFRIVDLRHFFASLVVLVLRHINARMCAQSAMKKREKRRNQALQRWQFRLRFVHVNVMMRLTSRKKTKEILLMLLMLSLRDVCFSIIRLKFDVMFGFFPLPISIQQQNPPT